MSDLIEEVGRLRKENAELRERVSALTALLAVIRIYATLPLPVKDDWQTFYSVAATRLGRVRDALVVLTTSEAKRWASVLADWESAGLDYKPDPLVEPKHVRPFGPPAEVVAKMRERGMEVLTAAVVEPTAVIPATIKTKADRDLDLLEVMTAAERRELLTSLAGFAPVIFDQMVRTQYGYSGIPDAARAVYRGNCPADDYDLEAEAIARRLEVVGLLTDQIVHSVLCWWSGFAPFSFAHATRPPAITVGYSDDLHARVYARPKP